MRDILISFPLIAEEFAGHIQATKDQGARETTRELSPAMLENGFTVSLSSRQQR